MMDGDAMYPEGFHPIAVKYTPDRSRFAEYRSRTVAGVRYYFVDFGISSYFPDATSPRLVTGADGRDQDPLELSDTIPYDPFKLDIFIIGNMLRRDFCEVSALRRQYLVFRLTVEQKFTNLEFLRPLTEEMTMDEPSDRPDAVETFALWKKIRETVWTINLEWRPRPRIEHPIETVMLDAASLRNFCTLIVQSLVERLPV